MFRRVALLRSVSKHCPALFLSIQSMTNTPSRDRRGWRCHHRIQGGVWWIIRNPRFEPGGSVGGARLSPPRPGARPRPPLGLLGPCWPPRGLRPRPGQQADVGPDVSRAGRDAILRFAIGDLRFSCPLAGFDQRRGVLLRSDRSWSICTRRPPSTSISTS